MDSVVRRGGRGTGRRGRGEDPALLRSQRAQGYRPPTPGRGGRRGRRWWRWRDGRSCSTDGGRGSRRNAGRGGGRRTAGAGWGHSDSPVVRQATGGGGAAGATDGSPDRRPGRGSGPRAEGRRVVPGLAAPATETVVPDTLPPTPDPPLPRGKPVVHTYARAYTNTTTHVLLPLPVPETLLTPVSCPYDKDSPCVVPSDRDRRPLWVPNASREETQNPTPISCSHTRFAGIFSV